ncbi:hypothetical protein CUT44_11460 [Streptomyces carminius]|uniref:DUF4397 domain-containing protein n=1 Tax=Streptomyces carminius TaxID=2665496 RepID=A0A2M8LYH8_9ACTN|nr:DUF4397 domain-containing protein [Streptomyces carminius]PJE97026.1 hypothetical protein CUT44_14715 [Streptomyces carminius]PJE97735.1 hypothetical protein CUT44_11460 [Streptomyces carminius]
MMNPRSRNVAATAAGVCALALTAALPASAAAAPAQDEKAMVSVFHAVPGLTVDVYANGNELLPDFEPGTLTEPQSLDPGTYDIEVFADGEGPDGEPAVQKSVEVPAGANATLAAHLNAQGDPMLTAFVNDTSEIPAGQSRLTVRHVAAAPAVDVRAGGDPVIEGLENPNEESLEVPAGTVSADVVLAGTDDVVLGPADLELAEGTNNVVYAWGSAEDESLALKTQTISGMHGAPSGVDAGESGAMAQSNEAATTWLGWGAAGAVAAAGLLVARRRYARDN